MKKEYLIRTVEYEEYGDNKAKLNKVVTDNLKEEINKMVDDKTDYIQVRITKNYIED